MGSVPTGLSRWSQEALKRASVPWRDVLRTAVRRPLQIAAGVDDYTFARRNRRRSSGNVLLPGTISAIPSVAVVVDTSGSIGRAELLTFISEIAGMVAQFKIHARDIPVIACDSAAYDPIGADEVLRNRELLGGGGTNMGAGLEAAAALATRPDLVVVLTDGYTPWPEHAPEFAVVVALTGATSASTPPWTSGVQILSLIHI